MREHLTIANQSEIRKAYLVSAKNKVLVKSEINIMGSVKVPSGVQNARKTNF